MKPKLGHIGLASAFAFLFATNPVVAEAARQITGADIKDGTVTAADVKNGSLKGKDLAEETVAKFSEPGPAGPIGPTGPAGPEGSPDTAAQVLAKLLGVDGAGSGVDADLLDGQSAESFLPSRTYKIVGPHTAGEVDNRTGGRSAELSCDRGDLLLNGGFYTGSVDNVNRIQGLNNYYGNSYEMEWWVPAGETPDQYALVVSCLDTASPTHNAARPGAQPPAR